MAFQPRKGSEDAERGSYRSVAGYLMPVLRRDAMVVGAHETTDGVYQDSILPMRSDVSSFLN